MNKFKQISAIIGIAVLVLLYILTIVAACMHSPNWGGYFKAAIYATIVIPCLIYGMQLLYRALKGRGSDR